MDPLKISAALSALAETAPATSSGGSGFASYLRVLLNAVAVLVYEPRPGSKAALLEEAWGAGAARPPERVREVQEIVESRLGSREAFVRELPGAGGLKPFLLCSPVLEEGRPRAFLAVLLVAESREALAPFIIILQAAGGYFNYRFKRLDRTEESWALDQVTALMELFFLSGACEDFTKAARKLADGLARHVGCLRVCLGIQGRRGMALEAVSGADAFDAQGTTAMALQAAMREAILLKEPILWPREEGAEGVGDAAHHELARQMDLGRIVTLPLQDGQGGREAVLSFLWARGEGPDDRVLRFITTAHPHLGLQVHLLRKASPGIFARLWRRAWLRLDQDRRRSLLGAAGAFVLLMLWPFHHRIRAATRIQPDTKRIVAAPFDGILKKAFVEPGQAVEAGFLLARMDDKELIWKQAELAAVRDRAMTQRDQNLSDQSVEFAVSQMAQYDAESVGLELEAVEEKIKRLEMRAPIPGVVILGDLRRAEGVPVSKGQVLFEVAPMDKMMAEIEIDADDISHVEEGMPAVLRIDSLPGRTWRGRVSRINPQSEARGGRNVFVGEASLLDVGGDSSLRPGMKGRAALVGRRRPLGWILFHRLWEVLDLLLFW